MLSLQTSLTRMKFKYLAALQFINIRYFFFLLQSNYFDCDDDCADAGTELAAGTPILLDHALSHHLTVCSIQ